MTANDILNEDVSDFATQLEAMTSDEVFGAMSALEALAKTTPAIGRKTSPELRLWKKKLNGASPGRS